MDLNQYLNPDFLRYTKTVSTGTQRGGFNRRGRGQSRGRPSGRGQYRSERGGRGRPPNARPPAGKTATKASGLLTHRQPREADARYSHPVKADGLSIKSTMGRTSRVSSSSARDFEIIARLPMKKPSATNRLWFEDEEDSEPADDHAAGPSGSARGARPEPRTSSRYIAVSSRSQQARGRSSVAGARKPASLLSSLRSGTYIDGGKIRSTSNANEEEREVEYISDSSRSVRYGVLS